VKNWIQVAALSFTALAALCVVPLHLHAAKERDSAAQSAAPDQTPLTAEQVHQLLLRTIANQHRDDAALDSFERIERHVTHVGSLSGPVTDEKTYRVVPTGSGTLKLLISQNGAHVPAALYQRQLRDWEEVLEVAVHPDDPREIAVVAKQQRRRQEQARFVDNVLSAYQIAWLGREIRDGRIVEKLQLDPNPHYAPRGDRTDWLTHARAIAWIDPEAAQVVSIDATIIRDISVGGGVFGKIYSGGRFHMEQAPAAPGIWEPTLDQYDISGRKFLFSFAMRDVTLSTHYAILGGPEDALAEAQDNLAHCCIILADP
jgi:hypothetical protein